MSKTQKTCFVVMPIRKTGTAEHAHFRAIFNHIKPTIENEGYSVERTDDVQRSGAITKDIVSRLAESDLVVADLTDLNPNVFYELGVRHALRGKGTVMIIDEKRTPDIPFDLGAYRVIRFSGDLTGIETLNAALATFLSESSEKDASWRDNPVHDWFPMLPVNVLETASQSSAAPLRKTIRELQDRIERYEKALGSKLPQKSRDDSPLSSVLAAISDAEDGLVPANVLEEARKAFEERDVVALLQKVRTVMERNVRLPSTAFIALADYANVFDLDAVVRAIFDQALQFFPSDTNLKRSYLATLAHSEAPQDREHARAEIAKELSLEITDEQIRVTEPERLKRDLELMGLLLDAYHRDSLHQQALLIAEKMVEMFPESSQVLRAYARALERVGKTKKAMDVYRAAILAPDVDDTSAVWLGNELHNQRENVAAAEAYAYACILDPADGANFAHLAEELSICLSSGQHTSLGGRRAQNVRERITVDQVLELAHCAASCPNVDAEVSQRLRRALDRLELPAQQWDAPLPRSQRVSHVNGLYEVLRSGMTTAGADYDFGSQHEDALGAE